MLYLDKSISVFYICNVAHAENDFFFFSSVKLLSILTLLWYVCGANLQMYDIPVGLVSLL